MSALSALSGDFVFIHSYAHLTVFVFIIYSVEYVTTKTYSILQDVFLKK